MNGQTDTDTDTAAPGAVVLSRPQKTLVGVVSAGVVGITGLGFAGSYTAVQHLAAAKGFGWFAREFPLGVDAGIGVFLALDLLLAALRMPYAPLRPFAWFLTGATVVFNASVSWGDPLAVGMHAVIPTLFVTAVEAARHAVARIARLGTGSFIESPPFIRWFLAPLPTFLVWRRMRMWHLTSYLETIRIQQETESFKVRLRARHGRGWRKSANEAERLALRLARYGTPVSVTMAAEADRTSAEAASVSVPVSAGMSAPVSAGQTVSAQADVSASVSAQASVSVPVSAAVSLVKSGRVRTRPAVSAVSAPGVRSIGQPSTLAALVRDLKAQGLSPAEAHARVVRDNPQQNIQTLGKTLRRVYAA